MKKIRTIRLKKNETIQVIASAENQSVRATNDYVINIGSGGGSMTIYAKNFVIQK